MKKVDRKDLGFRSWEREIEEITMTDSQSAIIEDDIENDTQLWLREEVDFSNFFINKAVSNGAYDDDDLMQEVELSVQKHFEKLRFAQFSAASLEGELIRCHHLQSEKLIYPEKINFATEPNQFVDLKSSGKITFPFIIPLSEIISQNSPENSSVEARLRQLKKDLERDKFLINNNRVIGAGLGMSGILDILSAIYDHLTTEESLPLLQNPLKEDLSHEILFKASRTHSGALVYHALQNLIDSDSSMLLPNSSVVPPIKINISLDKINHHSLTKGQWGIVAKISSEFIYSIQKKEDFSPDLPNRETERNENFKFGSLYTCQSIHMLYEDIVSCPINLSVDHHHSSGSILSDSDSGFVCLALKN